MKTSEKVLNFVNTFFDENGYFPSVREIGREVGLASTSTVYGHLERLALKGKISREIVNMKTAEVKTLEKSYEGVPVVIEWRGRIYKLEGTK